MKKAKIIVEDPQPLVTIAKTKDTTLDKPKIAISVNNPTLFAKFEILCSPPYYLKIMIMTNILKL